VDKKQGFLLLFLLLLITACVSTVEPTATPFSIQRIAINTEVEGLISPWLAEYVEESGQSNLKLELFSPQEIVPSLEDGIADLGLISQDVPKGWFATPLWREAIAVIVHPDVQLTSLDIDTLVEVFSGRVQSWDTLAEFSGSIQLIVPLPGSIIREKFIQVVMGNSFFDPAALIGGTPEAIFELVKSKPGAIGFVPIWRVGEGVNIVAIGGILPEEESVLSGDYPLWVDLVAVSPEEPVGHLREFLVWLQGTYLPSYVIP
jgi:ABC-type phosphate transport system substrate-binding protein